MTIRQDIRTYCSECCEEFQDHIIGADFEPEWNNFDGLYRDLSGTLHHVCDPEEDWPKTAVWKTTGLRSTRKWIPRQEYGYQDRSMEGIMSNQQRQEVIGRPSAENLRYVSARISEIRRQMKNMGQEIEILVELIDNQEEHDEHSSRD